VSEIKLIPYNGMEIVKFGDSREVVRKELGNYKEFKKSKFSKNTTDDFRFCHVFYDSENKMEAIEFFPEAQISLNEKQLFSFDYSSLKKFLKDESIKEDDSGARFPKYGISVYVPDLEHIESIMLYAKSYYDD
jgi:hypothetical protein